MGLHITLKVLAVSIMHSNFFDVKQSDMSNWQMEQRPSAYMIAFGA